MKANVLAYLTNGDVVRVYVQHPEVGLCKNGTHVGIFDYCYYVNGDDGEGRYEEVALYWTTEVARIYADNKCVWRNPAYIKDNNSIQS